MKAALVSNSAFPENLARKICVMVCLTEDWNASWNLQDGLPWSLRCLWEVDAAPQASWLCQQQISNPCPHEWFHSMNENIILQSHNDVWGWDTHYLATASLQPSAAASSPCCNLSDTSCVPIPHSLLLVQVPFPSSTEHPDPCQPQSTGALLKGCMPRGLPSLYLKFLTFLEGKR